MKKNLLELHVFIHGEWFASGVRNVPFRKRISRFYIRLLTYGISETKNKVERCNICITLFTCRNNGDIYI